MSGSVHLLEAFGLKVGYPGGRVVDVPDFFVDAGDFLCITGANGTGKTTLLKTLAGIIPAQGGRIAWRRGGAAVGYLPQQGPSQRDFPASVREVVRSGCQATRLFRPFYTAAERRRADRAMVRLGIDSLASRSYQELSGGQRQRALIARAIAAPRDILLLDEPTAALDAETTAELEKILSDLSRQGIAIVMVTHEEAQVKAFASRTLRLV